MIKRFHYFLRPAALDACLLIAALCLLAYGHTAESLKTPNMTALSPRLQVLFAKTKTVCFGRFIVEVPDSAAVVYGPGGVDGGLIEHFPNDGDKLAQRVAEQRKEVEKDRNYVDKDFLAEHPLFGAVVDGDVQGQKLVFGSLDRASYSIHSYIPIGRDLFVQHAVSAVSKEKTIEKLTAVARHLRLRAENEVPAEPGVCIDGGFLPVAPEFENIALGIRFKEFPDAHFSIEVKKNGAYLIESSRLEPRLKAAEKDGGSWYSRITFLRRASRQLGQWYGEEVLAHMPAQDDSSDAHEFHFYSLGALRDTMHPQLDIQLDTGVKENRSANSHPSLSDEEAVAVWDKLTASIRARPTTEAKAGAAARPKTP